jgi:putative transposase
MGTKGRTSYRITDQNAMHYLTIATVAWLDIFTRKVYKDILVDSLQYCIEQKGLVLYSYIIMSNHVHFIAKAKEGFKLSDILRDFKRHTAKQILKTIKEEPESRREWLLKVMEEAGSKNNKNKIYQVWRQDNHPIELYTDAVIEQKLHYIHNNAVEEGWVQNPEDYIYSSARNYADMPALLEITRIE